MPVLTERWRWIALLAIVAGCEPAEDAAGTERWGDLPAPGRVHLRWTLGDGQYASQVSWSVGGERAYVFNLALGTPGRVELELVVAGAAGERRIAVQSTGPLPRGVEHVVYLHKRQCNRGRVQPGEDESVSTTCGRIGIKRVGGPPGVISEAVLIESERHPTGGAGVLVYERFRWAGDENLFVARSIDGPITLLRWAEKQTPGGRLDGRDPRLEIADDTEELVMRWDGKRIAAAEWTDSAWMLRLRFLPE